MFSAASLGASSLPVGSPLTRRFRLLFYVFYHFIGILLPLWRQLIAPFSVAIPQHSSGYRPKIDGLRAVAVLAVVANHLNASFLQGGFLGVDIFFVISGYVVTSSLVTRKSGGALSFLKAFYERRFKRLLPALIATVLCVSLIFSLVASPFDDLYPPALRTGIASLFGVANLYLLKQGANYFSSDTLYNPFLHTWSLGVEEQFYLVWPLLLIGCGFGRAGRERLHRRRLALLTILLLGASLSVYLWLESHGQRDRAFYLMPSRFWELALGCLAY